MISVVICTYNRSSSLKNTLESLGKMSVPAELDWELIVVDNNSSDDTRAVVDQFAQTSKLPVRYIFEGKQGKSFALNTGIQAALGEIIAFTDDDASVDGTWIQSVDNAFTKFDCIGISGKTIAVWPFEKPSWYQEQGPYSLDKVLVSFDLGDTPCEIRRAPLGVNMAFRREAFQNYGVFRTDLGRTGDSLLGREDTEFGRRLLKGGEELYYVPSAVVYHPVDRKRVDKKYFQSWYFNEARSRIREELLPPGAPCYCGIPRYFFRAMAENCLKWLFTLDSRRRFYYKLAMCGTAGAIAEARRLNAETVRHKKSF